MCTTRTETMVTTEQEQSTQPTLKLRSGIFKTKTRSGNPWPNPGPSGQTATEDNDCGCSCFSRRRK